MSTLTVTNIKATGETASRAVSGVAAAWAFYNTKTTTSIYDSMNVSSLTDDGTGITSINFSNNFINNYYAASAIAADQAVSTAFCTDVYDRTSSVLDINTRNTSNAGIDCNRVSAAVHGDLA